jgi:hypothetical protein
MGGLGRFVAREHAPQQHRGIRETARFGQARRLQHRVGNSEFHNWSSELGSLAAVGGAPRATSGE